MKIITIDRYIKTIENNNFILLFYKNNIVAVINKNNNIVYLEPQQLKKQSINNYIDTLQGFKIVATKAITNININMEA